MMQSVCRVSRTEMVAFSTYLENTLRWHWTVVVPSPRMPLTTTRSPPASTELPASTTPPTWMLTFSTAQPVMASTEDITARWAFSATSGMGWPYSTVRYRSSVSAAPVASIFTPLALFWAFLRLFIRSVTLLPMAVIMPDTPSTSRTAPTAMEAMTSSEMLMLPFSSGSVIYSLLSPMA